MTVLATGNTPAKPRKPPAVNNQGALVRTQDSSAQFDHGLLEMLELSKFSEAARWFTKAAPQGHRLTQCKLVASNCCRACGRSFGTPKPCAYKAPD